jgi:hypothetical protein
MIAVRLFTQDEIRRKLSPYKCKLVAEFPPGFELWETGWGEPFTLYPDGPEDDLRYSDDQHRRFLMLVAKTMPPDWNGNGS